MSQESRSDAPREPSVRWLALLAVAGLFAWLWTLALCAYYFKLVLDRSQIKELPLPTEVFVRGGLAFREYWYLCAAVFAVAGSFIAFGKLDRWGAKLALAAVLLAAGSAMFGCISVIMPFFRIVACNGFREETHVEIVPIR